jgi:hypothetical protein
MMFLHCHLSSEDLPGSAAGKREFCLPAVIGNWPTTERLGGQIYCKVFWVICVL